MQRKAFELKGQTLNKETSGGCKHKKEEPRASEKACLSLCQREEKRIDEFTEVEASITNY